jgi:hypothetical protein
MLSMYLFLRHSEVVLDGQKAILVSGRSLAEKTMTHLILLVLPIKPHPLTYVERLDS